MEVSPAEGKWWRLKYRFVGKEKRISLGTYPETSLRQAREKTERARGLLASGIDPNDQRKTEKARLVAEDAAAALVHADLPAVDSFEHVAREWYETRRDEWAPTYGAKIIRRLEVDLFPWIGDVPIDNITPPKLLAALRRIEARGVVETAELQPGIPVCRGHRQGREQPGA